MTKEANERITRNYNDAILSGNYNEALRISWILNENGFELDMYVDRSGNFPTALAKGIYEI